ncbi:MAG: glycogen/starch synthase [Eubacteriales bacterium]|nr:glycogen/starch synthase [Eubacteriales bacterium]
MQNKKIKVLFAAFEASPFIKTGGLGDVAGSLPIYLKKDGVDIRVIMPLFSSISNEYRDKMTKICDFYVPLAWRNMYCGIYKLIYKNTIFYFLDNEYYFKRDKAYGFFDDGERIAFYSKAIIESILHLNFSPNIMHLNDWHTALSAVFLREMYREVDKCNNIKTVFTIHNIKFQGMFSKYVLDDITGLKGNFAAESQLMQSGAINYMRGALNYADRITTVSPTYAKEICTPFFSEGLEDVLCRRKNILSGILNGIDYEKYNPYKDNEVYVNLKPITKNITKEKDINEITKEELIEDKIKRITTFKSNNKMCLQADLGLDVDPNICMISLISRLTDQKGLDLITYILEEMLQYKIQFVILGLGDKKYEDAFNKFANQYKNKVSANIFFDESLSKKIYASSDLIMVPSLFEPCGLSQMIAMRYATLPIVREIGGLKDSVNSYNKYTNIGNGFSFVNYNAHELLFTIQNALSLYYDKKEIFNNLSMQAFDTNFNFEESAKEYIKLYSQLMEV